MPQRRRLPALMPDLVLVVVSFAPAPPDLAAPPPAPPARVPADQVARLATLLEARHRAAQKQFDETWIYYKQARTDAFPVYVWSHFVLQTRFDMIDKKEDQI